jgi:DNA-binding MarR family transcriptional regulator
MTAPRFLPQTIGTTENALRALLEHHLSGTGLSYQNWVLLNAACMSGGQIDRAELETLAMDSLKIDKSEVSDHLRQLSAAGVLDAESATVHVTATGAQEHARLRESMADAAGYLLRDLPDDDVSATMRTLTKLTERANLWLAGTDR